MALAVIITVAVELIIIFEIAAWTEYNRHDYKILVAQVEETSESQFDIRCSEENEAYRIYPVVYENQECYIVTRLYVDEGIINIDYDYQQIIEKDGQETFYVRDVYRIGLVTD